MRADEREEAQRLRSLWMATLGDTASDPEWRALSPEATYKPAGTTELDVPATEVPGTPFPRTKTDATLSGLGTLGPAAGTASGRATPSERTLSGRGTLGAPTGAASPPRP